MIVLSIILPTYKVERWIEKCIRSIENQNIPKSTFEIIVVNDESPDKSAEIAEKLKDEFHNIKIINQKNKGLAGARNTGIKNAIGEYLMFVDPDDYIEKDTFFEMLEFVKSKDLEIAMFGQKLVKLDGSEILVAPDIEETQTMTGMKLFKVRVTDSACKYLIKREYLVENNLFFLEEAAFLEDGEFAPRLYVKAKKTAFKKTFFYNYILREGSLITSNFAITEKAVDGYMKSYHHLKNFQNQNKLNLEERDFMNYSIAKFAILPIIMSAGEKSIKNFKLVKRKIKENGVRKLEIRGLSGMRKRHASIFNFSFNMLFMYILMKNSFNAIHHRIVKIKTA